MTASSGPAPSDPDCPPAARGGPVSNTLARVARLHRVTARELLRDLDLYPGQEFLMMHLWSSGPVRPSELIKVLDLDPSTVTRMLQRLEQAGHVRRGQDPCDRRAVLVEATEPSCALHDRMAAAWCELETRTLGGLDPAERRELARLLEKVETNLCGQAPRERGEEPPGAPPREERGGP
ncbi:MarR family transcriptional regulator [Streptomyces sp. SID4919]|uniref:MarR family winged helix-turn-helix transcriptional regulator n=1 Tax=unclassified Streptomyces TaxID=2593676 RepID=UPI000823D70D|nr:MULTISPECIES: MarR family winged helix-turn-helix transcriptional regulator [unclassified Streptomyces]MYY08496.1 MarR family transcriptional regulator [Streptomyces sp. SID4919]SCK49398.1 DNA-binding transcriptional regulator, MarR family [Streptomyces sp. AmelKG-E11A]